MEESTLNGLVIEIKQGNIIEQPDVDAIVNAANAQLQTGGGVAGAIHRVGDPELRQETKKLAPIETGEAVISSAPNFPNSYIIHVLGPVYGRDKPEKELLASCFSEALNLADQHQIESLAFPAISTGAFGYPLREAAEVSIRAVMESARQLLNVKRVRFVLFSESDTELFREVLNEQLS
ncbi:MAG: RNase III inhibitor [Bacteroidetes bacterium]|jgi:O-acetyl-ADP-ribose deacetylase (regulator of RNase III)|nr:RNase III inhibitor [Bacteroidota bacterium]